MEKEEKMRNQKSEQKRNNHICPARRSADICEYRRANITFYIEIAIIAMRRREGVSIEIRFPIFEIAHGGLWLLDCFSGLWLLDCFSGLWLDIIG